jgi:hypothetical protein
MRGWESPDSEVAGSFTAIVLGRGNLGQNSLNDIVALISGEALS